MNTSYTSYTSSLIAAARFHALAATAAANGGFWVSASGGTANVVAGEIARATGVTFEDAHHALDATGGDGWYQAMAEAQPWPVATVPYDDERDEWYSRWDARTIARAACRPVRVAA